MGPSQQSDHFADGKHELKSPINFDGNKRMDEF